MDPRRVELLSPARQAGILTVGPWIQYKLNSKLYNQKNKLKSEWIEKSSNALTYTTYRFVLLFCVQKNPTWFFENISKFYSYKSLRFFVLSQICKSLSDYPIKDDCKNFGFAFKCFNHISH